jgi:hypothetical protein
VTVANGGTELTSVPTNGQVLIGNGTNYTLAALTAGTGISVTNGSGTITIDNTSTAQSVAIMQDQKSSGTGPQTSVSAAWTTKNLNTEVTDPDSIVSIASNQFTPISGTYLLYSTTQGGVQQVRQRLRNVTGGTTAGQGAQSQQSTTMYVRFTANGTDAYEIQYYSSGTAAMGVALTSGDVEVYLTAILIKVG